MAKDYAAIAAKRIQRPANIVRKPNLLIYGRNKKGKTTFGISAGVEKTLVLDPEHGTDLLKTKNPHVWPINSWTDLDDAYGYLRTGDHPYEWIVLDGLTRISNMALRYVMNIEENRSLERQPGLVQQRDYGKSGELMRELITRFHNLPQGVIYTCQERMFEAIDAEEDEDAETAAVMFVPDLPKGVRGMVESLVDVIGRIYTVRVTQAEKEVVQRRLWIGDSVKYTTGYRSDYTLPDVVKAPSIPKLVKLMEEGKLTAAAVKKAAAGA